MELTDEQKRQVKEFLSQDPKVIARDMEEAMKYLYAIHSPIDQ